MTPERWEKVKQILGDALEREPAERERFVRDAAGGDGELESQVLLLLADHERDSELLSRPALASARASLDERPRFTPSTVLARRFRVVRFIARGGMGEVYEAEDLELGERVALKAIRPRIAPDADLRAMFKREIQLARRVTHPNVCRIFDLAQHDDPENGDPTMLLSMELVEGQTLAEHLRLNGPMAFKDALPLIEDIAAGLQAVHDAGIIHGDLKPGNVMLVARAGEPSVRAMVMDFGMALPVQQPAAPGGEVPPGSAIPDRAPSDGSPATVTLAPPDWVLRGGTPEYFAPEQNAGSPASIATDVYAFALVIADTLGVPRPVRLKPEAQRMPSHWARVLRRCLETDPERRYSRPDEMAKALRRRRDPRSLIAIAGVVALVGALAVVLVNRGESPAGTQNRRLFAAEAGLQVWSSSPDGRSVAATEFPSESLILKDVRSGKVRRVAPGREAIFSPDGKRLAYVWYPSRTESELRVIGVDGTGQRTLYRDPEVHPTPVDWSPDGRRILVRIFAHDTTDRLAVVSVENATLQLLPLDDRARFGSAIFAQDGIGVVVDNGGEIRRFTANGSGSTLVGKPGSKRLIGWSPDRRDLIFLSDRKGRMGIWAVSVVNDQVGEPREVAPNVGDWESLGVTRTGALLYRSDANAVDVYTATLDLADGRTVSPPKRVMDQFVGTYAYPNWSDDGRWLIFDSRHRPGVVGIYDLTTGARRELQTDLQMLMRPQWLSHGSAIMLVGLAQDRQEGQFRIDPATGKATLFMTRKELGALYEGVWSPDGKTYFNRYMDWRRGIFRLDAQTRERTVIYVPPSGVDLGLENLTLSPDGHTLAFHARNDGEKSASLMLIPAAGGNARPLLTIHAPEQFLYGAFTWTPDSRRLLTTRTKNGVSEIWQVPVDGSPPTKIDFPPMRILSLRLSHDGKTIAFSKTEFRSEIWMLQNFL